MAGINSGTNPMETASENNKESIIGCPTIAFNEKIAIERARDNVSNIFP
jgi:hypothetical protein